MKIALTFSTVCLVLAFTIWCLFVTQILKEGRARYIRDFCPNISDPYCPR